MCKECTPDSLRRSRSSPSPRPLALSPPTRCPNKPPPPHSPPPPAPPGVPEPKARSPLRLAPYSSVAAPDIPDPTAHKPHPPSILPAARSPSPATAPSISPPVIPTLLPASSDAPPTGSPASPIHHTSFPPRQCSPLPHPLPPQLAAPTLCPRTHIQSLFPYRSTPLSAPQALHRSKSLTGLWVQPDSWLRHPKAV